MSSIRASLAVALMLGMGSTFPIAERALPPSTLQLQPRRTKAMKSGGFSFSTGQWNWPARDGWSVAHGKRMAKKRRNQARHRNATKGK